MNKIIAVMSGLDWYDANVKHIILIKEVDLEAEKLKMEKWYKEEYRPSLDRGEHPEFYTFTEWLIKEGLARECTEDEVLEVWDYA